MDQMKKSVIAVMTRGAMPTRHLVVAALVQSRNLVSVELKWNLSVLEPSHFMDYSDCPPRMISCPGKGQSTNSYPCAPKPRAHSMASSRGERFVVH